MSSTASSWHQPSSELSAPRARAVRTVEQHSARISYASLRASRALAGGSFAASPHSAPTAVKVSGTTNCGSSAADARRGGRAERRLLDAMRALDLVLDGRGARGGGRERAAAVARGRVAPARLRPTVTRLSGAAACAAARRRATRRARARAARRGRSPWPDRAAAARARGSRGAPCRRAITRASARSPSRARPRAPRLRVAPVLARAVRACGLGRRGVNGRGGRRARSPRHARCTPDGRRGSIRMVVFDRDLRTTRSGPRWVSLGDVYSSAGCERRGSLGRHKHFSSYQTASPRYLGFSIERAHK